MRQELISQVIIPIGTWMLFPEEGKRVVCPVLSAEEWEEVFDYASAHGLLPVLAAYMEKEKVEDEAARDVVLGWYWTAQQDMQETAYQRKCTRKLARVLKGAGLDVMFLKGACLAEYYASPLWRKSGDIDFYVFGRVDEALEAMRQKQMEVKDVDDYHVHIVKDDVSMELHRSFLDTARLDSNTVVEDALNRLAQTEGRSVPCPWMEDVQNAFCMPPTMNAIFLMRHMQNHFVAETVSLRMLYDWGLFLKREADKVDWAQVMDVYERAGMKAFAERVQQILYAGLGIGAVAGCPIEPMNDPGTERMWRYILKQEERSSHDSIRLLWGLSRLWEIVCNKWKFTLAYPKDSYFQYVSCLLGRGVTTLGEKMRR